MIKKYVVNQTASIFEVLAQLNELAIKTIYVVDDNNRLLGSITDGDIRRFALTNKKMEGSANECMHSPCFFAYNDKDALKLIDKYKIFSVPLINNRNAIERIVFNETLKEYEAIDDCFKNVKVVMMAGGRGERLFPYTSVLPKPLIPINGVPIAERILQRFTDCGLTDFILSLNYKKNIIKAYFDEAMKYCNFTYVEEEQPLGTAGSLNLVKDEVSELFVIVNCDILVDLNINSLLKHHKNEKNLITAVSALRDIEIPYGVLNVDEQGQIIGIEEKPTLQKFINTGMYVVDKNIYKYLENEVFIHMTDLIQKAMEQKERIGIYAITSESFMDMGIMSELDKMQKSLK